MKLTEILKSSLMTLKSNGRRTFLTMIGIIIGIAAVITILSLGNGFKNSTTQELTQDENGRRSQMFHYNLTQNDLSETVMNKLEPFSQANLDAIEQMVGVDEASTEVKNMAETVSMTATINGKQIYYEFNQAESTNYQMLVGRNLASVDSQNKRKVIVINEATARELFQEPIKALHQSLTLDESEYTIIGVYKVADSKSQEDQMMMYGNIVGEVSKGGYKRDQLQEMKNWGLTVYFKSEVDMKPISRKISNYLKDNGSAKDYGSYEYYDQSEMMEQMSQTLDQITYFITAVAAISLFIAGVGVMNMMYISVSERTKEIGIRRSLGATKRSIQLQFLLEGIAITTLGGVLGYLLGVGLAILIGRFLPFGPAFQVGPALMSLFVSIMIGIIFSVFPAKSASEKNVVEILR